MDGVAIAKASPDQSTLAERNAQTALFTGAVLRDAYHFLINPSAPAMALGAKSENGFSQHIHHLGAALLGKRSTVSGSIDTLAFADRSALPAALPDGWTLLDDATTLSALDHLGETWPLALAATEAFEMYLARKAMAWSPSDTANFTVEFIVAFGRELTPRLDVHHRIRSTKLKDEEVAILRATPFAAGVDQSVLRRFQQPTLSVGVSISTASPRLALEQKSPEQTIPTNTTFNLLTRPETPGLPMPPGTSSVLGASPSGYSKLFQKI